MFVGWIFFAAEETQTGVCSKVFVSPMPETLFPASLYLFSYNNSGKRKNMKPCDNCGGVDIKIERVDIGKHHRKIPKIQQFLGVCTIYLPILTLPFVLISGYTTLIHLRLMGAQNIKPLKSFFPDKKSFRYTMKNQVTMEPGYGLSPTQTKLFWILNCTWYCPVSVGIFEWHAYLVKLVENWWCPFKHSKKEVHYRDGAIDQSFWHIHPEDIGKLTAEDRDNPIWNESAASATDESAETK